MLCSIPPCSPPPPPCFDRLQIGLAILHDMPVRESWPFPCQASWVSTSPGINQLGIMFFKDRQFLSDVIAVCCNTITARDERCLTDPGNRKCGLAGCFQDISVAVAAMEPSTQDDCSGPMEPSATISNDMDSTRSHFWNKPVPLIHGLQ